jgi:hypothetical protein
MKMTLGRMFLWVTIIAVIFSLLKVTGLGGYLWRGEWNYIWAIPYWAVGSLCGADLELLLPDNHPNNTGGMFNPIELSFGICALFWILVVVVLGIISIALGGTFLMWLFDITRYVESEDDDDDPQLYFDFMYEDSDDDWDQYDTNILNPSNLLSPANPASPVSPLNPANPCNPCNIAMR